MGGEEGKCSPSFSLISQARNSKYPKRKVFSPLLVKYANSRLSLKYANSRLSLFPFNFFTLFITSLPIASLSISQLVHQSSGCNVDNVVCCMNILYQQPSNYLQMGRTLVLHLKCDSLVHVSPENGHMLAAQLLCYQILIMCCFQSGLKN